MYSNNLIPELPNTAHSCSRHGPAIAWITSERFEILNLFQKHLQCWKHECIISRNKIDPVEITFCVFFYNLFPLKIFDPPRRCIA